MQPEFARGLAGNFLAIKADLTANVQTLDDFVRRVQVLLNRNPYTPGISRGKFWHTNAKHAVLVFRRHRALIDT